MALNVESIEKRFQAKVPAPEHGIEPVLKDEAAMDRGRLTDQPGRKWPFSSSKRRLESAPIMEDPHGGYQGGRQGGHQAGEEGARRGLGRGIARVIQGRIAVRGAARVSTSPVERARYAGWSAAWYGRWNPRNPTRTRSAVRLRGSPVESLRLKQHADGHELANTLGR